MEKDAKSEGSRKAQRENRELSVELDQTLARDDAAPALEANGHHGQGTKQSVDLAFAVSLLQSGHASMRILANAAKSWTTYGSKTLAEHLLVSGLISNEQRALIERKAHKKLNSIVAGRGKGMESTEQMSQTVRERHWLTQLDPGGKVAKLLGIADSSVLANDEVEDRRLGSRYTLLRKLGQGGLGVVWLARDQNLQRYVAIKEINRGVASDDVAIEHFRREAEITGRLEHPGIVPVYQYGEDEGSGKAFYVMRFLGKRTLQDAIAEYHERREVGNDDPMLLHRLLTALINVCNSVGHAHSRKVIHRDLKPDNVALDEFGQVTLLDWGLAMINEASGMYEVNGRTEPGDLHSVGSTQVGRVLGTPLYMAPEQAAGRLDEVDELTDVYALGGMLYAILTGVAPHQASMEKVDSSSNLSDIMSEIVSGTVVPPRDVLPSVPPELNAVCMKALSNKRYLRYESAAELEEEIQRFIAGTPVEAYKPPRKQRIKRWMADHPTITQSILLITSLLLIGGAAIAYTASQGRMALRQARYTSVEEFTRELEVNLDFETEGMVRNLLFVSELPLMDAIVLSHHVPSERKGIVGGTPRDVMASQEIQDLSAVGPAVLLNRQANLFEGLLNANPAYLIACTCMMGKDGAIRELVRNERTIAAGKVYPVPKMQLNASPPKAQDSEEAKMLESMRPHEVLLITNDQLAEDVPVKTRSPLVLSGVAAVFGVDGEFFGINIIELDLRRRLEELFSAVAPANVSVSVTDVEGNVVLKYHEGLFSVASGHSVTAEFPELSSFFDSSSQANEFGDGKSILARKVSLGDSPKAIIGIVAHIRSERDL